MDWQSTGPAMRVAVLAGGMSAEREVSLESGRCVANALQAAGYTIEVFDPAHCRLEDIPWGKFEACFIALHGGAGEDGRIQAQLEYLQVPYTGSGPSACRLAMSKSASKERFWQGGVPTLPYVLFPTAPEYRHLSTHQQRFSRHEQESLSTRLAALGFPLVIKPDSQGSSLGVSVALGPSDLDACLAACRPLDAYAIAEPLVRGREFTVAVLHGKALPLLEIVSPSTIFDYQAKYVCADTVYRFDTGLESEMAAALELFAEIAADCLGACGLCRVDVMLDHAGHPWVLEVNTVPGMTEHSLAPMAARKIGLEMPELCHQLVQRCLARETIA